MLERLGGGFGVLGLAALLSGEQPAIAADNPLAAKRSHFPAKAKSVIFLFMHGGPSHLDTFDPKPLLQKLDGQKLPPSLQNLQLQFTDAKDAPIMAPTARFERYGQSGIEVSELFSNVAAHIDDIAVIRSCHHEAFVHSIALNMVNTGSLRVGLPSMGSWILYGLGSESRNLPSYIVMDSGPLKSGPSVYGSGFLPAIYQGTKLRSKGSPFLNLNVPPDISPEEQLDMLSALRWYNERHLETRRQNSELSARINAYELAFRMQAEAPDLVDIRKESEQTRKLYGINSDVTADFGMKCLLARRMVERGIRFIQLYSGTNENSEDWDTHGANDVNQRKMARRVDKPIAGLLADLKQRALLDSTLVIWGGDFGRTPVTDGQLMMMAGYIGGRDHNPYGFTMWMAGGGVKGGQVIGETDELGFRAVKDAVHVHDVHATILALLGLDHTRLTYLYQGRNFRLTDTGGKNIFAQRLLRT